ncbi:helix-turn-helix domain-containing protein [Bacilliculturomica massiliensis]|uniref:helix-turn-helix domain-containing protein n=1 Tax=Bacilliculturomica massiliensis TaxID=1917867 RepID=UPI0013EF3093|nr:helix-turn-helix domain-containing protein [Bacilliculturomica massiliensis]
MADTFSNSLINNSIYHLLNFEKYSNFQAAAREAAVNNNFQLVLFSTDFNTVFSVETQHNTSIEEAVRRGIEKNVDKNVKNTRVDVNGLLTYWGPVTISGVKYYLMLADNDNSYSQEEISKLAEIIELAMGMWRYKPERDITAEFIKALRRGNRSLAYSLKSESDFSEAMVKGVYLVPGVEKDAGLRIITAFEQEYDISSLKIAEGDEISGVLLASDKEKEYGETEWKNLAASLKEAGAKKMFHVNMLDGIDDAAGAFQIINETEPFIQLIFPYKKSFSKYELALASNCVNISLKGGSVKKNYLDLLKPFKTAGESKSRQLMETLETFVLDAGLNTAKTSRLMEIHSNTVQYRLKRIKEILGVDITGNTIVPGLMIALAIARIEKKVRSF